MKSYDIGDYILTQFLKIAYKFSKVSNEKMSCFLFCECYDAWLIKNIERVNMQQGRKTVMVYLLFSDYDYAILSL